METLSVLSLLQTQTATQVIVIIGCTAILIGLMFEAISAFRRKRGIVSKFTLGRREKDDDDQPITRGDLKEIVKEIVNEMKNAIQDNTRVA